MYRHIRESYQFDFGIAAYVLQLLGKPDGHRVIQLAEIASQIYTEVLNQSCCLLRIFLAKVLDRTQRIVYKVGLDLADHNGNTIFLQLCPDQLLLRFHFLGLSGSIDVAGNDLPHQNDCNGKQSQENITAN